MAASSVGSARYFPASALIAAADQGTLADGLRLGRLGKFHILVDHVLVFDQGPPAAGIVLDFAGHRGHLDVARLSQFLEQPVGKAGLEVVRGDHSHVVDCGALIAGAACAVAHHQRDADHRRLGLDHRLQKRSQGRMVGELDDSNAIRIVGVAHVGGTRVAVGHYVNLLGARAVVANLRNPIVVGGNGRRDALQFHATVLDHRVPAHKERSQAFLLLILLVALLQRLDGGVRRPAVRIEVSILEVQHNIKAHRLMIFTSLKSHKGVAVLACEPPIAFP